MGLLFLNLTYNLIKFIFKTKLVNLHVHFAKLWYFFAYRLYETTMEMKMLSPAMFRLGLFSLEGKQQYTRCPLNIPSAVISLTIYNKYQYVFKKKQNQKTLIPDHVFSFFDLQMSEKVSYFMNKILCCSCMTKWEIQIKCQVK